MHKYVLEFQTENGIEEYYIQTNNTPRLEFPHVDIPYMSYGGDITRFFKPLDIIFIDSIHSKNNKFLEWINSFYYNPKVGKMGGDLSCKRNIILKQTDPTGFVVEKWILRNCFLMEVENMFESFEEVKLQLHFYRSILDQWEEEPVKKFLEIKEEPMLKYRGLLVFSDLNKFIICYNNPYDFTKSHNLPPLEITSIETMNQFDKSDIQRIIDWIGGSENSTENIVLHLLDPAGGVIFSYILKDCWVIETQKVDDLSYHTPMRVIIREAVLI